MASGIPHPATDKQAARRELQRLLHRLVNEEGIRPEDIIILTPSSDKRSGWKNNDKLGNSILTWDMETEMDMAVRVCSIYRFKGLESAVVILTELDQRREEISDQLICVGLSRARHHAIVIGELPLPTGKGMVWLLDSSYPRISVKSLSFYRKGASQ